MGNVITAWFFGASMGIVAGLLTSTCEGKQMPDSEAQRGYVQQQLFGNEERDTCILHESIPYCARLDGQELADFVRRYYEMEEELEPKP
ncbi:hypothetical protein HYS49_02330 [Candidatus Woesearchaeota archaeon]|nr:hypothetical protein [Candidatus Woesearchaeota archaeon]